MATGTLSKVRRVRRSEAEWRELFTRFDESDQTRERFCAEQDLVLSSFAALVEEVASESAFSGCRGAGCDVCRTDIRT